MSLSNCAIKEPIPGIEVCINNIEAHHYACSTMSKSRILEYNEAKNYISISPEDYKRLMNR